MYCTLFLRKYLQMVNDIQPINNETLKQAHAAASFVSLVITP